MSYKYDVFLSYKRKYPNEDWVNDLFFPLFKGYLEEALGHEVKIFKDTHGISAGDGWNEQLQHALIHSRLMVSILSPSYFASEWCKKEFAVMDYRQRQLGFLSVNNPSGLIVPLKIFDGYLFPEHAKSIHISDFNRFYLVGEAVKKSALYLELQVELQTWINNVVKAHLHAPEWNQDWLQPNWVNDAWLDLDRLNCKPTKNHANL